MTSFRLSRRPDLGKGIRVSFEFFPPKTPEAAAFLRMYDAARFTPETLALAIGGVD
mgnify:CR=1 FL=1